MPIVKACSTLFGVERLPVCLAGSATLRLTFWLLGLSLPGRNPNSGIPESRNPGILESRNPGFEYFLSFPSFASPSHIYLVSLACLRLLGIKREERANCYHRKYHPRRLFWWYLSFKNAPTKERERE